MITVLLYLVMALFGLKILWNLLVPYVLAVRMWRAGASEARGISLAPAVDLFLMILAIGLCFLADLPWSRRPLYVGLGGVALVATSYLHLVVASALAGLIASRLKRARDPGRGS